MSYRKQASLTTLNFEILILFLHFNNKFGDTAKVALKEICSFVDFLIISLKHFQLFGLTIPGHAAHKPINSPENNKKRDFI